MQWIRDPKVADQVATDLLAEELGELAVGDRLIVDDAHQEQAFLLRERA